MFEALAEQNLRRFWNSSLKKSMCSGKGGRPVTLIPTAKWTIPASSFSTSVKPSHKGIFTCVFLRSGHFLTSSCPSVFCCLLSVAAFRLVCWKLRWRCRPVRNAAPAPQGWAACPPHPSPWKTLPGTAFSGGASFPADSSWLPASPGEDGSGCAWGRTPRRSGPTAHPFSSFCSYEQLLYFCRVSVCP